MTKPSAERYLGQPDRCPSCEWANTGLLNYSTVPNGPSLWLCHGCAARRIAALESELAAAKALAAERFAEIERARRIVDGVKIVDPELLTFQLDKARADLARVTAERDEQRARADRAEAERDASRLVYAGALSVIDQLRDERKERQHAYAIGLANIARALGLPSESTTAQVVIEAERIIAERDALKRERDAARKVAAYAMHRNDCASHKIDVRISYLFGNPPVTQACDCGLDAARKAL